MTVYLLRLLLVLVAIKAALNGYAFIQCRKYLAKYRSYVDHPCADSGWVEASHQVLRLFKSAGIEDIQRPYVEVVWPQLATGTVCVFANLTNTRQDIVQVVLVMLHSAIGVYRSRVMEAFNPLYWIEVVVNLPRHALGYLGVSPERVLAKAAQLVYWALALLIGFLYSLFRPELEQWVRGWIAWLRP